MATPEVRLRVLAYIKSMMSPIMSRWESCDEPDTTVRFGKELKAAIRGFERIVEQQPNARERSFLMILLKKGDFFTQQSAPYLIDKFENLFDWQLVSLMVELTCKPTSDMFQKHHDRIDWNIITYRLLVDRNPLAMYFMSRFAANLNKLLIAKVSECLKLDMGNNRYIDELYDVVDKNVERPLDDKTKDWIKIAVKMLSKSKPRELYYAVDYPLETTVNRKYYMSIEGVMKFFFAAYKEQHPRFILLNKGFPSNMDTEEVVTRGHDDLPYMYWSFPQELRYAFENSYFTPKIYRMKAIPTHPEEKPTNLKIITEDQGDGTCNVMVVDANELTKPMETATTTTSPKSTTAPMGKCKAIRCECGKYEINANGLQLVCFNDSDDDDDFDEEGGTFVLNTKTGKFEKYECGNDTN